MSNESSNCSIDTTSREKFYETYKKYYLDTVKFNKKDKKLQYVFLCREYGEMFFLEGYSLEEIYFYILFKISFECCDDIYCYEYPLEELKDPVKLIKSHYFDNDDYYSFEEVIYTHYELE